MTLKYLHTAKLTIEDRVIDLKSINNPDGMNFDFTIVRERYKYFSEINVNIFNANELTLKALAKKQQNEKFYNISSIRCDAGYQGDNKLIFDGTVHKAITQFVPGGSITRVKVSDYSEKLLRKVVSREYKQAPNISKGLQDIASAIGKGFNKIGLQPEDDTKMAQTSYVSNISDFITKELTANRNIAARIFNDVIYIYSTKILGKTPEVIINKTTGMINTPMVTDNNLIRVENIFEPSLKIDTPVKIESDKFQQPVVQGSVFKLTHSVSADSGLTTIEVLPDGQNVPRPNIGIGV